MKPDKQHLTEEQLATALHSLENNLDSATVRELAERRQIALDAASTPLWQCWILPSGAAFASALLLAIFLSPLMSSIPGFDDDATTVQLSENIELYEDFEFYSWLANAELNEHG
ncbi:MAG: hypothetical protein V7721_07845 [Porticoccaceae bacterium]